MRKFICSLIILMGVLISKEANAAEGRLDLSLQTIATLNQIRTEELIEKITQLDFNDDVLGSRAILDLAKPSIAAPDVVADLTATDEAGKGILALVLEKYRAISGRPYEVQSRIQKAKEFITKLKNQGVKFNQRDLGAMDLETTQVARELGLLEEPPQVAAESKEDQQERPQTKELDKQIKRLIKGWGGIAHEIQNIGIITQSADPTHPDSVAVINDSMNTIRRRVREINRLLPGKSLTLQEILNEYAPDIDFSKLTTKQLERINIKGKKK